MNKENENRGNIRNILTKGEFGMGSRVVEKYTIVVLFEELYVDSSYKKQSTLRKVTSEI